MTPFRQSVYNHLNKVLTETGRENFLKEFGKGQSSMLIVVERASREELNNAMRWASPSTNREKLC